MDKRSEGSGQQTKNQQISPGTMGSHDVPLLQIKRWVFICSAAAKYVSDSSLVMLIGLPVSSQLALKAYLARRQYGQTGNIMAIGLCLRAWLLRSKRHLALRLLLQIILSYIIYIIIYYSIALLTVIIEVKFFRSWPQGFGRILGLRLGLT